MPEVTVGIDIGTTSVKALAVDADGSVLRRARVPHELVVGAADQLEHRPDQAWRDGVRQALAEVAGGLDVAAVEVAAMVPSMCAVDDDGRALTPGLLYGDSRAGETSAVDPSQSGESVGFVRWCAGAAPGSDALMRLAGWSPGTVRGSCSGRTPADSHTAASQPR